MNLILNVLPLTPKFEFMQQSHDLQKEIDKLTKGLQLAKDDANHWKDVADIKEPTIERLKEKKDLLSQESLEKQEMILILERGIEENNLSVTESNKLIQEQANEIETLEKEVVKHRDN